MIREATPDDCVNLAVLSIKVWLTTYATDGIRKEYSQHVLATFSEDYFLNLLVNPNYELLVSVHDGVLQGFVLVNLGSRFKNDSYGFEIEKLYVDDIFSRKGLGRKLLKEVALKFGSRFWLYTWVENASNGFYQHLGFSRVGRITLDFHGLVVENHVYSSVNATAPRVNDI